MGIDLRRRNAGMPQHFLNLTQIGTTRQEMRGKTMTQRVRADRIG